MSTYDPNNPLDAGFASLAYQSPVYAASAGFPIVLPGESFNSYLNRIYPGTHWHPGAGNPLDSAIQSIGGAAVTATLDVASLGLSSSLGLDTTIHAGIAGNIATNNGEGFGGKTYASTGPSGYLSLLQRGEALAAVRTQLAKLAAQKAAQKKGKTMIVGVGSPAGKAAVKMVLAVTPANTPAAARLRAAAGLPPEVHDAILIATPPPVEAAAVPWYQKKILGPVNVAEAAGGLAALGALWKWVL